MTSQNSPQLLVSNKFDLAASIGSDLTSFALLFACIAEVVEGLTLASERRPDGVVRKFAKKNSRRRWTFASRILLEHDLHFLALTLAAVLYSGFFAMSPTCHSWGSGFAESGRRARVAK